jgi:hypothetical protein
MFSKYDLHEAMGYKLGETPWESPPTPQEMRVGLSRALYYSTLLRNAAMLSEREGWTDVDKYTAMAFYMTLAHEQLERNFLEVTARLPPPPIVIGGANDVAGMVNMAPFVAGGPIKKGGPYDPLEEFKKRCLDPLVKLEYV